MVRFLMFSNGAVLAAFGGNTHQTLPTLSVDRSFLKKSENYLAMRVSTSTAQVLKKPSAPLEILVGKLADAL